MTEDNAVRAGDGARDGAGELTELGFTIFGFVSKPVEEVYEAVADPAQLSEYFTTTTFEFEPVDAGARTRVSISDSAWSLTDAGAKAAFGNSMGWTGMLAAMKVWLEHGIQLREGFYK